MVYNVVSINGCELVGLLKVFSKNKLLIVEGFVRPFTSFPGPFLPYFFFAPLGLVIPLCFLILSYDRKNPNWGNKKGEGKSQLYFFSELCSTD